MSSQESDETSNASFNLFGLTNKELFHYLLNILNVIGLLAVIYFLYWGYQRDIFTSEVALRSLLNSLGPGAPYGFILIQIVQTIIPIIPGALTIPMGAMIFGGGYGFLLNFIGIMIGSVINFILARKFGRPLVEMLVSEKKMSQYISWLDENNRFDKIFTFGMFFPVSPADILCYIAGLSNMSFKKYFVILSLGKPFTLFLYSYGTLKLLEFGLQLFT